jgi:hypothetical protein
MSAAIVRQQSWGRVSDVPPTGPSTASSQPGCDGSGLVARRFWVLGRGFLNTVQVEQQPDSLTDLENFRQTL